MIVITQFISGEADAAADRYGVMIETYRAMYARALDQSHFGSPKQMADVTVAAYQIAGLYLDAERQFITDSITAVASEAQRVTLSELSAASSDELTQAVSEHADQSDAYLEREISIQVERDITLVQHTLPARAQGVPQRTALMEYRLSQTNELNFVFHDRAAHKWPSRRFVRSLWRARLLAIYNETVLLTLSDHGVETAVVSHTDEKSPVHGMEVTIAAGSELPTYSEIQNEVFHPNSEAILKVLQT